MRLSSSRGLRQLLLALLLALTITLSATSASAQNEDAPPPETPAQRKQREEVISLAAKRTVIPIKNMAQFRKIVTPSARSYDGIVLFTASAKVGCARCPDSEQMFAEVADTAAQLKDESIFFFQVSFDTSQDVFAAFQLNHAPVVLWIPSEAKHDGKDLLKLIPARTLALSQLESYTPDSIAAWVSARTGRKIEIYHSPVFRITVFVSILLTLAVFGKYLALHLVPRLRRAKWAWFLLSLMAYGLGVSGTIYSFLRSVPQYGTDGRGNVQYFAHDRHQYLIEGYLVGMLLLTAGLAVVLSVSSPPQKVPIMPQMWNLFRLVTFVVFFLAMRSYAALYTFKAAWYAHGVRETGGRIVAPWI